MKILGLSSDFHDSSAALVIDGELRASAAEERFTRNKHDANFPRFATEFCLAEAGLSADELDLVVYYERPVDKWIRVLESSVADWPRSRAEFVESQSEWLGRKLWRRALISKSLGISPGKILEINHHTSHLVQAFVGSEFKEAAILTVDAVGERATASMARAAWRPDGTLELEPIAQSEYPHSLGLFYSAMTAFLGFKPMNDECTTMALAAFGEPKYADELRRVLAMDADGFWRIDPRYLKFDKFLSAPWTEALTDLLGRPRDSSRRLGWSSLQPTRASDEDRHWADLAASVQLVLEEALLHSALALRARTGLDKLCLAGGVAMNCVANTRLMRESGFRELFVPIEPGDGGASIGAAFAGHYLQGRTGAIAKGRAPSYSVFSGQKHELDTAWLEEIDIAHSWEYQKHGMKPDERGWKIERVGDEARLAAAIAAELNAGKVVAVARDRFELGPRALGHRSILFRADSIDLAERVSGDIKDRAPYRPYALAMLPVDAAECLADVPLELDATPMRWMQMAVGVKPEAAARVRSGLHVDGTTRPQVVTRADDRFFHDLLVEFKALSGTGALINTSFNESGYPLVNTPEDALLMFARTSLDVLVIGDVIVRKVAAC